MLRQRLIITNNPLVRDAIPDTRLSLHNLIWIDGCTEEVLTEVRNYCHKFHRLITHPLTGSIKPNQTPYKTVIIAANDKNLIDYESILTSEMSLSKTLDMLTNKPRPIYNQSVLTDFAVIDLAFFQSYLETIHH